jgi:hypothetical protein
VLVQSESCGPSSTRPKVPRAPLLLPPPPAPRPRSAHRGPDAAPAALPVPQDRDPASRDRGNRQLLRAEQANDAAGICSLVREDAGERAASRHQLTIDLSCFSSTYSASSRESSYRWGSSLRSPRLFPSAPCRPSSGSRRAKQDRAHPSIQIPERPEACGAPMHRTNGSSAAPAPATPDLLLLGSGQTGVGTGRPSSDKSRRSCRSREAQSGRGTRSRDMGTGEVMQQSKEERP